MIVFLGHSVVSKSSRVKGVKRASMLGTNKPNCASPCQMRGVKLPLVAGGRGLVSPDFTDSTV